MNNANNTVVIYHGKCPDGFGAAFAAWLKFGDAAQYVPADYCDAPPDVTGKDVFILDFSYKRDVMEKIDAVATSITLLDHHETAQNNLAGFKCSCGKIHFDTSKSGARMAWEHFNPGTPIPLLIQFIEDRDLWKFVIPNTDAFLAYLDMLPFSFEQWHALLDDGSAQFAEALAMGTVIHQRVVSICTNIAADAVPVVIDGLPTLMVSCSQELASMVGDMLYAKTGTFAVIWRMESRGTVKVSLRGKKPFNVKVIAERFGGGGHPQAASFRLPAYRAVELLLGELSLKRPGFWRQLVQLVKSYWRC